MEDGGVDQTCRDDDRVPEDRIKKEDSDLLNRKDWQYFFDRVFASLSVDDSEEFVKALEDELREGSALKDGYIVVPSKMLSWTIHYRAIRCAKTLLLGTAPGYLVDVNAAPDLELSPIHQAATKFLPDFVNLFIMCGAKLDIPADDFVISKYRSMLPLNAAIAALREKISWTPAQSFHELISFLCDEIELEEAFYTISHIMMEAPLIQNRKAICDYVKEGKIVELTILLYVDAISGLGVLKDLSHIEYLSLSQTAPYFRPFTDEDVSLTLDDHFGTIVVPLDKPRLVMHTMLIIEIFNKSKFSLDKRRLMMSAMLIIEIFNKTKFSNLQFSSGHEIFAKKIKDAGFDLDDVLAVEDKSFFSFLFQNLVPANEAVEDKSQSDIFDKMPENNLWYFSVFVFGIGASKPKWMTICYPRSDPNSFDLRGRGIWTAATGTQTFQASQKFKSRIMSALFPTHDAQAQASKATHKASRLLSSSLGKMWSVFPPAIKRRIMIKL